MTSREKQIRIWVQKQKNLMQEATDQNQKDYLCMMWLGYLNGLRLTNVITSAEYRALDLELQEYAAGIVAA